MTTNNKISKYSKPWIALIIAVISVSWASILVVLSEASGLICALWRLIFSSTLTWIILLTSKRKISINKKTLKLTFTAGLCLAIHFTLWMESLFMIPVAISTTIVSSNPLFSSLLGFILLREKPSIIQIIGTILAIIGISILAGLTSQINGTIGSLGVIYALIGALTVAIYFTIGRNLRRIMDTVSYTALVYSFAAIILLVIAIINNENILNYNLNTWSIFIALALIPMLLGHTLLNYALKFMKLITVTTITLGEPIGATILAKIILNQQVKIESLIAIIITLTGITLTILREAKEKKSEKL
ncbi:MAG: DMT family transporter [archaeon GB-1867-035]|mgnify:CR=1 FL=1|nr:DMT family transporter [Candidatus Culexmicrobium profundum]